MQQLPGGIVQGRSVVGSFLWDSYPVSLAVGTRSSFMWIRGCNRTVLGSGRSSKRVRVSRCFHAEVPVVFSQVLGSGAAVRPSMVQECTSRFSLLWGVAA